MKQVLINLVTNAIKYNRANGTVTLRSMPADNGHLKILVSDTGVGIREEKFQELFEPFSRLDAGNGPIEGTGIGLSIVKRLIEQMNGKIAVRSTFGEGSTFEVEVPMSNPEDIVKPAPKTREANGKIPGGAAADLKILYVEDNPANLKLVNDLLSAEKNISLLFASHAQLGIDLARSYIPDLILLDIHLPGIDGFEALKILKKYEETKNIPVIALSASAVVRDKKKSFEAGFDSFISKPIVVEEFYREIEGYLPGARLSLNNETISAVTRS